jgi:hypothetical protein
MTRPFVQGDQVLVPAVVVRAYTAHDGTDWVRVEIDGHSRLISVEAGLLGRAAPVTRLAETTASASFTRFDDVTRHVHLGGQVIGAIDAPTGARSGWRGWNRYGRDLGSYPSEHAAVTALAAEWLRVGDQWRAEQTRSDTLSLR